MAILDADKEGYLRLTTSSIQTGAGRAARHLNGEVILYADVKTQSIQRFLPSHSRRERQIADNKEHNITPRSVIRAVEESLSTREDQAARATAVLNEATGNLDVTETVRELEEEMLAAAEQSGVREGGAAAGFRFVNEADDG